MTRRVEVSTRKIFNQEFRVRISVIAERTVGAALRGRPASNSISTFQSHRSVVLPKDRIPRRAALRGRPYSKFGVVQLISLHCVAEAVADGQNFGEELWVIHEVRIEFSERDC